MRISVLLGLLLMSCGEAPREGNDAGTQVNCSTSATLKNEVMNGRTVVTARGVTTCDAATSVEVETCLQWIEGGAFTDVKCVSSTESNVTSLTAEAAVGCLGTKTFRARVVGNGDVVTSAEQSVTCL